MVKMLALLNGKATIVTVYYWIALLCSQSTGGSCGYPDVYEQIFKSRAECETWMFKEAKRYALKECKQVQYSIDIGHPYEGAIK